MSDWVPGVCVAGNDHQDIFHWVEGIGYCEGHCPDTFDPKAPHQ